ncbi:CHC2 zinc finger domain-containing protein [Extensimonas perlucida]|uniref:CHC2 zinc finger domain-containing protein n=1 Tax=Extensimonas perlucida TaxID=2590786 RepID=UPI001FEA139F|nr:CHC2 zinc finger domain-containing protein [Extensimonas perlucida]
MLQGRGKWRTAPCNFHGGSDSLRVNSETGAWVCMAGCGARGGDVLAYHRALTGKSFVEAAKDLGAWVGGDVPAHARPAPFPARDALELLAREAALVALAACTLARGEALSEHDKQRLLQAAARVSTVAEVVL